MEKEDLSIILEAIKNSIGIEKQNIGGKIVGVRKVRSTSDSPNHKIVDGPGGIKQEVPMSPEEIANRKNAQTANSYSPQQINGMNVRKDRSSIKKLRGSGL